MTLREKILLAAMGAAVMGGGIQFGLSTLLPSPAPSGTDSSTPPGASFSAYRLGPAVSVTSDRVCSPAGSFTVPGVLSCHVRQSMPGT